MTGLAQRIRARRLELGLTQVQVAQATGIAQCDISRYESGAHRPMRRNLVRLAGALGCTPDDLTPSGGAA